MELKLYVDALTGGAEHNFDDPGATKQKNPANAAATEDARKRAEEFFRLHLQASGQR